jgi:hypothetical protein
MYTTRCPQCGTSARAPAPGKYRCPRCQALVTVMEPQQELSDDPVFTGPIREVRQVPPELPRTADFLGRAKRRPLVPSLPPLPVMLMAGFGGVVLGLIFSSAIEPFMGLIPTMVYLPIVLFGSGWFAIFCAYRLFELKLARYRLIVVLFGLTMAICGWVAAGQYTVDQSRIPEMPFVNPWQEKLKREASMSVAGTLLGLYLGCFLGLKIAEYLHRLTNSTDHADE